MKTKIALIFLSILALVPMLNAVHPHGYRYGGRGRGWYGRGWGYRNYPSWRPSFGFSVGSPYPYGYYPYSYPYGYGNPYGSFSIGF